MKKINLFSSPLWAFDLLEDNPSINSMVTLDGLQVSKQLKEEQLKAGTPFVNTKVFFEHEGYGSGMLRDCTEQSIAEIGRDRSWPSYVLQMRARYNALYPNECDTPHHHLGLDLVGVYWVTVPENSGDLLLIDPRGQVPWVWEEPLVTPDNQWRTGRAYLRYKPKVGTLVLFPSYLFHSVETNLSNETRISIVMDVRVRFDNVDYANGD